MGKQPAARAHIQQRFALRVFADEVEIVLDLPVNGRFKTVIVELEVTTPTIEVFRIIIKRGRLGRGRDRRGDIFTVVAFVYLFAGKVSADATEIPGAKQTAVFSW